MPKFLVGLLRNMRDPLACYLSAPYSACVLCLAIALIVAICTMALGHTLNKLHQDAVERSYRESGEFASVLAGQTSRSLEAINIVLEEIAGYAAHRPSSEWQMQGTYAFLQQKKTMLPAVDVISIADQEGKILNLTRSWPAPPVNIADRDYFMAAKSGKLETLVVSEPAANRVTGTTTVYFAQRIEDEHGTFLGTVNVGVSPERLLNADAANSHVDGRALLLALKNGIVLAHSQIPSAVGSRFPQSSRWYAAVARGGGRYSSSGYFDNIVRLVTVQPLRNWPLVVNVSQKEEAALATWHQVRRSSITYAAFAIVGTLALAVTLARNYRRLGQAQAKSWKWAHEDPLTLLPNRRLLVDHLNLLLRAQAVPPSAILFVDLDRFKAVNDSFGHAFGDELLQRVAARLRGLFREADFVSRIGGDEFVVVVQNIDEQGAPQVAMRVVEGLSKTYTLSQGLTVNIGASIGIRLIASATDGAEKLIDDADRALYKAKKAGRGRYSIFDASFEEAARTKMALDGCMRSAFLAGEFEVHYQPIVSLTSNRALGCEALLRWRSPDRGLVLPGVFIPLAEETGFIEPLSQWVLERAIVQMAEWKARDVGIDFVAVNLCAPQFERSDFIEHLDHVLELHGLDPNCLTLEVTEGMAMQNQADARRRLLKLSQRGYKIALDDFGTGYSSLAILRQMPIHRLKIDRGFVSDVTVDPAADAIIQTIIELARKLDLQVVAEGIETRAQLDLLKDIGCPLGQGYLLGRPLPADEFEALVRNSARLELAA